MLPLKIKAGLQRLLAGKVKSYENNDQLVDHTMKKIYMAFIYSNLVEHNT